MIEADELRALCQRIIQSGELGRSRTYAAILEYLAEQAIIGNNPKEIAIAMEVLGRDADFDVGKDSIVRVHIYHLRNKLNTYYAKHGKDEKFRVDIPKGQYVLASTLNEAVQEDATGTLSVTGVPLQRKPLTLWLAGIAIALLVLNLFNTRVAPLVEPDVNPFVGSILWAPMLDDDLPVLVLVGDYYIMGELDESGNITRMVREFDVNSGQDLLLRQQRGQDQHYLNLDLSYTPTSIPAALAEVMKVFGAQGKRVSVKLMSDFTTGDLVGKHVIYIGYLSALQNLTELLFSASGLTTGLSYDELIDIETDARYLSSSGLSTGDASYRDYGLLSTFPAPGGTQYLFLAGLRDEGLTNLAAAISAMPNLQELEQLFGVSTEAETAFEALFEVLGFNSTNFEARLVYSNALDTRVLWQNRLLGIQ
jgi:hypothetical protein